MLTTTRNYVDNLIHNTYNGSDRNVDLNELYDYEIDALALRLLDEDEQCLDFVLDHPEDLISSIRDYMKESSVDNAIELASAFKTIMLKHYENRMKKLLQDRCEVVL